jgi:hypothetical protein
MFEEKKMKDKMQEPQECPRCKEPGFVNLLEVTERINSYDEVKDFEDTLVNIFPDLWEELGEAIRNLIVSNYRSVFRSLRWIVESVVFWADIELDKKYNDAIAHFDNYYHNYSMSKENTSFLSEYIVHYNIDLIDERLHLKEKYGKPTFKESVNNLTHLNKDKKIEKVVDKIQRELNTLYHDFSAFTHISMESYQRDWDNPGYYPYSIDYTYNKEAYYVYMVRT